MQYEAAQRQSIQALLRDACGYTQSDQSNMLQLSVFPPAHLFMS